MSNEAERSAPERVLGGRSKKQKGLYSLPAAKLTTSKQFNLLKAFAIASGTERKAVTIQEVGTLQNISPGTVSICNPFFQQTGLVEKIGHKFKASLEVLAYYQRLEWNDTEAGKKLAPILRKTWFAEVLIPRLQMNAMTEDSAIQALSDTSNASPSEKRQLLMTLDYLELAGIIVRDGNMVRLVKEIQPEKVANHLPVESVPPSLPSELEGWVRQQPVSKSEIYDALSIPIPGHANAKIEIPKAMDSEDWEFFRSTLDSYLNRLQKKAAVTKESSENNL
ncbi:MAG: hypothetical protein Q7U82_00875 [Gammaproteobacteria bacterium]|nr:hypothetical protein [Gammaproteobacteria bacterium]